MYVETRKGSAEHFLNTYTNGDEDGAFLLFSKAACADPVVPMDQHKVMDDSEVLTSPVGVNPKPQYEFKDSSEKCPLAQITKKGRSSGIRSY